MALSMVPFNAIQSYSFVKKASVGQRIVNKLVKLVLSNGLYISFH
jgi:hypothetical protein